MDELFWKRIELYPLFQRIVLLNDMQKNFGYEATIRGKTGKGKNVKPDALFRKAEADKELVELDNLARKAALSEADLLGDDCLLFLNCHGDSLKCGQIFSDIDLLSFPLGRIVLEVTEQTRLENIDYVIEVLKELRNKGMKLALDDFGSGFSNFWLVEALEPDFIKLDRSIIANIEYTQQARIVVEGMVAFAEKTNIKMIAEGIEKKGQKMLLQEMGIEYGQGFYFGYPFEVPKRHTS